MLNFATQNNYPIKIPSSFHIYDFIELLGKGSTCIVILIEDQKTKERYSAKVISKIDAKNRNVYDSIIREINVHKSLSHPNIVQFHESFEFANEENDDEYIVIVMEYCENGDLLKYATNHKFKSEMIKKIICDFLRGVKYLHSLEISHGDFKAENILLDSHLTAKLCDFGYCRTRIRCGDDNKNGTLYYSAPELLSKGTFNSLKTDIYAIGITLYTLAELKFPFDTDNDQFIPNQILNGCLTFKGTLDKKLRKLIEKCTNPDPDCRPTIDEILNDEYFTSQKKDASISNELTENYEDRFRKRWNNAQFYGYEFESSDDSDC